jgi:hypothetical protein
VKIEPLTLPEQQVAILVEPDFPPGAEHQPPGGADRFHLGIRGVGIDRGGNVTGQPEQDRPMVACPLPVSASDPNSETSTRAAIATTRAAKSAAAVIGPMVCELDGPIPILNRSNVLVTMKRLSR